MAIKIRTSLIPKSSVNRHALEDLKQGAGLCRHELQPVDEIRSKKLLPALFTTASAIKNRGASDLDKVDALFNVPENDVEDIIESVALFVGGAPAPHTPRNSTIQRPSIMICRATFNALPKMTASRFAPATTLEPKV